MRRRRIQIYNPNSKRSHKVEPKLSSEVEFLPATQTKPSHHLRMNYTLNTSVATNRIRSLSVQSQNSQGRVRRLTRLRKEVTQIVAVTGALSLAVGFAGFTVVNSDEAGHVPKREKVAEAMICVASIVQLPLIVAYWSRSMEYWELRRRVMRLSKVASPKLSRSPRSLLKCFFECLFNLVLLLPLSDHCVTAYLNGSLNTFCYKDLLFSLIIARVYHFLRLFFWVSRFSDIRTGVYTRLTCVTANSAFVIRCFLAEYSYSLIVGTFATMVVVPGLLQFLVEHKNGFRDANSSLDEVWVVAYTQATIGYGESPPTTILGRVIIAMCCFAGVFTLGLLNAVSSDDLTLNLRETNLCSELLLSKLRKTQKSPSIELIQSWWRFLRMRHMQVRHAAVIINFYSRLGTFRRLLVERQLVRYGRFEYQIQAVGDSVRNAVGTMSDYLASVEVAVELV